MDFYDIIIIGSGMSGLYSALKIKEYAPSTSFLILEKYKQKWIGGRASNDTFYGTEIVTGAGIGRAPKDYLLLNLMKSLGFKPHFYTVNPSISSQIEFVNVKKIISLLKQKFDPKKDGSLTFEQFAKPILGSKVYKDFVLSVGYSDFENEDVEETLYHYGLEDNTCCWEAFQVPWKKMVDKLYNKIGSKHFRFSSKVVQIKKVNLNPCIFHVTLENGKQYLCNRVIIGTTIDATRSLLPQYPIYKDIEGQPFLRLYGKFDKQSSLFLKQLVHGFSFVKHPIQRIIPMDVKKGVYMIAYNDNKSSLELKDYLENNERNREYIVDKLEKVLNIEPGLLHMQAMKPFYWPIGTHYYKPLDRTKYKSREEFVDIAQHPEPGILVVGEAISRNQGWTQGALESVEKVVTRKWAQNECP